MWYVQRFDLDSTAQAASVASAANGGGSVAGVDFPPSTRAVAIGDGSVVVAVDDVAVAVASKRASKDRYVAGLKIANLGDVRLELLGVRTVSEAVALVAALNA